MIEDELGLKENRVILALVDLLYACVGVMLIVGAGAYFMGGW